MRMILAVMYRDFRIRSTSLNWMFYDIFMPLVYLLVFGIGFNSAFAEGVVVDQMRVNYNAFFLAGVLSMAGFGIAINTSYGFFLDRENGIFYEFLTYPMTRSEFLIGKILFNCILVLVQACVTITVGSLVLHLSIRWDLLWVVVIAQAFGTAGWFFFLMTFAIRIRRNDMFNTFINVVYFVFMFSSSMFYPVQTLPGWLQTVSRANPLTWHTDVLRYGTIGAGAIEEIIVKGAAFAAFLIVCFAVAVQTIRNPLRA
jgi:ABC-2 type transport system permease protein